MKLTDLKGIGPKTEALFKKAGVNSAEELIRYYPAGYDMYEEPVPAGNGIPGAKQAVRLTITRPPAIRHAKNLTILASEGADLTGKITLTWFNMPYLAGKLRRGTTYILRGTIIEKGRSLYMEQPSVYTEAEYGKISGTMRPVYSLTRGLSNNTVIRSVEKALSLMQSGALAVREFLPETLLKEKGFLNEKEAICGIHFPKNEKMLRASVRRLVFDEFFLFSLAVKYLKNARKGSENSFAMTKTSVTDSVVENLPYRLTAAQKRVFGEVKSGLLGKAAMHRLIEGDVGSGKTIIAFLAMCVTAENGYQSAIMVPTEVLARQHYEKLVKFKEQQHLDFLVPVLLTGSLKAAEKREAADALREGRANAAVGTQALIQDAVKMNNLALVITDEQHRFGVNERRSLEEKNINARNAENAPVPNSIVMSATPIPRTLGVILYADLDISIIDELPARRLGIKNAVVDESYRAASMRFIKKEIEAGRQCYVICPMIEPSDELHVANVRDETRFLKKEFPDFRIEELDGRMKTMQKNKVMQEFAGGKIDILVSTTVVEVGVDVPNASVMLIENAERFGLAALHQLRGRVGRGTHQSYCIFMAGQKSQAVKERLDILGKTADGFKIAEKDFEMRGPGDLLGIRQSGDARFRLADVSRDRDILLEAGNVSEKILKEDPELKEDSHEELRNVLENYISENERNLVL